MQDLQHRLASSATARPQATAAHLQGLERHTQQQTKRLAELEQDLQQREGEAVSQGKNGQRLQAEIVLLEARLRDAQQIAALAKQRAQEELADRNVQGKYATNMLSLSLTCGVSIIVSCHCYL